MGMRVRGRLRAGGSRGRSQPAGEGGCRESVAFELAGPSHCKAAQGVVRPPARGDRGPARTEQYQFVRRHSRRHAYDRSQPRLLHSGRTGVTARLPSRLASHVLRSAIQAAPACLAVYAIPTQLNTSPRFWLQTLQPRINPFGTRLQQTHRVKTVSAREQHLLPGVEWTAAPPSNQPGDWPLH